LTKKKIYVILLGALLFLGLWNHQLIIYGLEQASGQWEVIRQAKPIEVFLNDPNFPDSLKNKLYLIQEVRDYAIDSLGINDSKNYTTLFDQKNREILWVITACQPFELKDKKWTFPLLGSFSYKGFFNYQRALNEKKELELAGFDTGIRSVSAWSTLGWLSDPIMSNMLYRSEGELANLIIHELTHATLYVKDSVEFNENLASFIGDHGARRFLAFGFGPESKEYNNYVMAKEDREAFSKHFLRATNKLDSLYGTFTLDSDLEWKKSKKLEMIKSIMVHLDTVKFHFPGNYGKVFDERLPNNTYFMSFLRYRGYLEELEQQLKTNFGGDLDLFLSHLKEKYPSL